MGTFGSFRKAYGALKDTTKVGLAKVNSEFKDLDIAIVKATNHVECPPKERHVRKIFSATSVSRPRADVAYCIHALAKRLSKTKNWIVAIKILIVIHRTLREGDPTFREELLNYSCRGHILHISNFKDDSGPLAWDCSAWVRTYALFIEERLECFRILKYDIETERLAKSLPAGVKQQHQRSRSRQVNDDILLEQLPALQQLIYRLVGCQPEGAAAINYLVQYALALVLKESFKIYCAINDGIINLVDRFFDMSRHDAIKALNIYKRAGQQAQHLADFYDYCKRLDLARNFQFPALRQPPPSFLATMEEYIKEAPQTGSVQRRLEYEKAEEDLESENEEEDDEKEESEDKEPLVKPQEEEEEEEQKVESPLPPPLIDGDLLGLTDQADPRAAELMESNALALAILPYGNETMNRGLPEISGTGWELALVSTPSNMMMNTNHHPVVADTNFAGGFDRLLLDSLYEDESSRRQIQMRNAGYSSTQMEHNPFEHDELALQAQHHDPFVMSNSIAPPTNVQLAMLAQQQQHYEQQMISHHHQQQMLMLQQQQQQQQSSISGNNNNNNNMVMTFPYHHTQPHHYPQSQMAPSNPFGDPFNFPPPTSTPQQGNHFLL